MVGKNSNIEWTDHTFNPWMGCTKVSAGCKHCYAEALMDKRLGKAEWGPQGTRVRTSEANWRKPLAWDRQAAAEGRRHRVFCASLADVFEDKPDQPEMDEWRVELFNLIIETPNLDWLLLTKRPENVCRIIERVTGFSDAAMWLPRNVWIGTSVENQEQADKRMPHLLCIPAAVRFLSMEPLLGAVDLSGLLARWVCHCGYGVYPLTDNDYCPNCSDIYLEDWERRGIDWVIVGGESGPNARPMHPDWARSIRDQCVEAGVPFFFKQWGKYAPAKWNTPDKDITLISNDGEVRTEDSDIPNPPRRGKWAAREGHLHPLERQQFESEQAACMVAIGKKSAGRTLDGRKWDEFPKGVADAEA